MAKKSGSTKSADPSVKEHIGAGEELHQEATSVRNTLTTNQGPPVSDDQNSLKLGDRGPPLLEDFHLREKITHFDHERVVHVRGYGAHGFFQTYEGNDDLTMAGVLSDPRGKTAVFCRFSTVAGSKGSFNTAPDVRGWVTKFYRRQGNYDRVGNYIPAFFIQDATKFPDLIHAVKPEPDRKFSQAQSAHDKRSKFSRPHYICVRPLELHLLYFTRCSVSAAGTLMEGDLHMTDTIKDKVADAGHTVADAAKNVGHKIAQGTENAVDFVKEKTGMRGGAEGTNAGIASIKKHMDVIASCGKKVGVVDDVEDGALKLTKKDSPDNHHHFLPFGWIERVDNHVHLNKNSQETEQGWKSDAISCRCVG